MGYDLYIEGISEADKAEADALQKQMTAEYGLRDAFKSPDRDASNWWEWKEGTGDPEWWTHHKKAEELDGRMDLLRGYFHLNIHGMSRCRSIMDELGMIDWGKGG